PAMLLTAVIVIMVSASSALAGTSSMNLLPSVAVRDTLPPVRGTSLLAVCCLSSCTVTLSGLPAVTKSIAGPLPREVVRFSSLHDDDTATSRRTNTASFGGLICFLFGWLIQN